MSEPAYEFGYECKLYRGDAGGAAGVLVDRVINLRFTDTKEKRETTSRLSGGMKVYRTGLRDVAIEFELPWDPADPNWISFRSCYDGDSALAVKVADSLGANGIEGDFLVEEFSAPQQLGEVVVCTIKLCPTDLYGRVPTYI
jgi:hypothetical protein